MKSRSFWVKGDRDDYAHFLARTHNANLLDVSSPFHFEIKSREFSSLILRRVSIRGQCSNSHHLQDAFIGLIIVRPGSGFSTGANGHSERKQHDHHSILWHFASDDKVYNHHYDSDAIYIRLETARFLRELAFKGLTFSTIIALHGQEASPGLIRLGEQAEIHLEKSLSPEEQDQWADQFLIDLIEECQVMGALKANRSSLLSCHHVRAAIQWFCDQNSVAAINLEQLAKAIHATPRTIQASFQSQFKLTPMRWLKLWRLTQLHRLLFHNHAHHLNANAMIQASGLGSIDTANRAYRIIYDKTPLEEINLANRARGELAKDPMTHSKSTYTIDEAIAMLSRLKQASTGLNSIDQLVTLRVKLD